jgi:hypothetical protein
MKYTPNGFTKKHKRCSITGYKNIINNKKDIVYNTYGFKSYVEILADNRELIINLIVNEADNKYHKLI